MFEIIRFVSLGFGIRFDVWIRVGGGVGILGLVFSRLRFFYIGFRGVVYSAWEWSR